MLLATLEIALGAGTLWVTSARSYDLFVPRVGVHWSMYLAYGVVLSLGMASMGLYNPHLRPSRPGIALRLALAALAALLSFGVLSAIIPGPAVGLSPVGLAAAMAVVIGYVLRATGNRMLGEDLFKRRVLVYGAGRQAASVSSLRRRSDQIGFSLSGFVPAAGDVASAATLPRVHLITSLSQFALEQSVDEIVVAMDDRRRAFPVHDLLQCRLAGIEVTEVVTFLERETGRVRLDVLNPGWIIFGSGFHRDPLLRFLDRALDLGLSVAMLVLLWPVLILVASAIKLEDGLKAPVFFSQRRVGLRGRPFRMLKFRSMRAAQGVVGGRDSEMADAERITRVGRFIRRTALDELPQLINVLRGEMRLVGPRPEQPAAVERLSESIPYYSERLCVPPGVTGWAQLCHPYGGKDEDAAERLQYDLYYLKNRSMMFDIAILLQTVEIMLFSRDGR